MHSIFKEMTTDMNLHSLTEATQEAYIRRANQFFCDVGKDIHEITIEDIRNYVIYLKEQKKLSYGTINSYISGIKFFYTITLHKEWDQRKVPRMRGYKPLPAVLSKEEVFTILDAVNNLKHKVIFMLMYGSGLRVSEVVKLKISDIDSKNSQIFISQSKNKRDRYAILPQRTLEMLREYWKTCGKPQDWLFPGANPSEHLNVKSVKNLALKLKDKLKIKKKISAHTFRHCFATHLLEDGVQLPYIQQLLGHNSFKSTLIYIHMTSKAKLGIKSPLDER